ncbi:MAG: GNAT family N-acetyltransferase, partial [Deltaproteobacteria bacterium]
LWRSCGIGRRLVEAACVLARQRGARGVRLHVFADRPRLVNFYRSLVFVSCPDKRWERSCAREAQETGRWRVVLEKAL